MTDEPRPDGAPPTGPAGGDTPPTDESAAEAWPSLESPAVPAQPPSPSMPASAQAAPEPWEPTASLPASDVRTVGETGTFGATPAPNSSRRGSGLRWIVAIVGVALVAAASIVVVSLVGGRPATSTAMGYMPEHTVVYTEARLDLPGDQRDKLASFLKPFPGFQDSGSFDAKLNETLDRIVRAASHDAQNWSTDIAPWFGGQLAVGASLPDPGDQSMMSAANGSLFVATVRDRGKAIAWIQKTGDKASLNQTTYGDADLFENADQGFGGFAIAVNDKVMLGGSTAAVKAAIDTNGKSAFTQDDSIESALATVQKDYVSLSVTNIKAYADWTAQMIERGSPGALARTQLDETILGMLPAWSATSARFENDALVSSSVMPSGAIGHDATNRADQVVGHVPVKTVAFFSVHDAGETLNAHLAKFRALPEAQPVFSQVDKVLNLLGGFDATIGWWGDAAIVVTPLDDGTIGAGLVIKPKTADGGTRLAATLNSFIGLGGGSAGVTSRTADHNGTQVTIVTPSNGAPTGLPPGYKAEFAFAANAEIAVVGYGEGFVNAVLDAKDSSSLGGDARFQGLLNRVGSENIGLSFIDIGAVRKLIEPFAQTGASADAWAYYAKEIQPYLAPLDAWIGATRKDGSTDHVNGLITVH